MCLRWLSVGAAALEKQSTVFFFLCPPSGSPCLLIVILALTGHRLLHAWGSHPFSSLLANCHFKKRSLYPCPWQGLGWPLSYSVGRAAVVTSDRIFRSRNSKRKGGGMTGGWLRDAHQHQLLASFTLLWASRSQTDQQPWEEFHCSVTECFFHTVCTGQAPHFLFVLNSSIPHAASFKWFFFVVVIVLLITMKNNANSLCGNHKKNVPLGIPWWCFVFCFVSNSISFSFQRRIGQVLGSHPASKMYVLVLSLLRSVGRTQSQLPEPAGTAYQGST